MLDCCEPLEKVKKEGISFGKLACLAHCNGAKVEDFRTNESTIDDFRSYVVSCTASEDCHVITSYHRAHLKQTGTGHFSPIGGYHAGRDMILILDVARFKYPPHWVPLSLLWEAMDTVDDATGHHRGFMIISRLQRAPSVLYTMSCRHDSWNSIAKYLIHEVPSLLRSEEVKDVKEVLSTVIASLPSNFNEFIKWVAEVRRPEDKNTTLSEEEKKRLDLKGELLKQVQEIELFANVTKWLDSESSCSKNIVSVSDNNTLQEIAANVCCQGAELFAGKTGSSDAICCKQANVGLLKSNGQKTVKVVCGTVITGGGEQRVDMLVPLTQIKPTSLCGVDSSNCGGMHPSTADVLTVLFLALPEHTWSGIKNKEVQETISGLVLSENLPALLQEEVLHLRRQLHFLMADHDAGCPL